MDRQDPSALAELQARKLSALVALVQAKSPFYQARLAAAGIGPATPLRFPDDLPRLPFTTKADLVADQDRCPPWGSVITEPLARYTRYNHTSGTTGHPLRWIDTAESWAWAVRCWVAVYEAARVTAADRVFFAFSFGPFFGFWTAYDAAARIGAHSVPAGGMSSEQRLALVDAVRPTAVCCTPTYALRLAEVAAGLHGEGWLGSRGVRVLIVAGEPGGSIPATRERIERAWNARVIDHHGLTEVGPVSYECWEAPGFLHLNEAEFLCEVLDPETAAPVPDGSAGELVITNLGRGASPVLRYRTGDIVVRDSTPCPCGRSFRRLAGGIRSRVDDMVAIRGVNVYPAAVEAVVRRFDEVQEFRATVSSSGTLGSLAVDIEIAEGATRPGEVADRVSRALSAAIGLQVAVTPVQPGSLPRFEMKARRFVRRDG
ncbi:MAG: phenylacetate--CoA ligase [Acidimicrobiia bacterium]|nr:phenylacetate--CoA ligase [Acidimicrobiia bacterium]